MTSFRVQKGILYYRGLLNYNQWAIRGMNTKWGINKKGVPIPSSDWFPISKPSKNSC